MLVSCLAYSSTLKREAAYSSIVRVIFCRLHGVTSQKITFFNIKDIIFLPFQPTYLAHSPNIPPIVTIHCATGQPVSTNTFGIGASESCVC
jgi:hypothetical protein